MIAPQEAQASLLTHLVSPSISTVEASMVTP
jgi:hypothetical protein